MGKGKEADVSDADAERAAREAKEQEAPSRVEEPRARPTRD